MSGSPPYRILLVDDNPEDREIFRRFLTDDAGTYLFLEAGTGAQGIDLFRAHSIDCVLLDYWLPDQDGFEFVNELGLDSSQHIPIVMLTGEGSETVAVAAMQQGICDYVPKELLTPRALRRIVGNAIEKATLRRMFNEQRRELRRRERELSDFAENAPVGLQWLSPAGSILWSNRAACALLGYSADELCDKHLAGFFTDANRLDEVLARLRRDETICDFEASLRCKDGRLRHVLIDANVFWEGDRFVHSRFFVRDITERTQAEQRLQRAFIEKDLLLQEVRHRVKNNLQVVVSLLALQRDQFQDAAARQALQETENRVRSIAVMHEMLYAAPDLGRIEAAEYLRVLTQHLGHSLALDSRQIELETNVDDLWLGMDQAMPCGLIINELVTNALEHAFPAGGPGTIQVVLRRVEVGTIELIVRDNGLGLPNQLDLAAARSLGLQLVGTLSNQLGGQVEIDSGQGTRFRLTFLEKGNAPAREMQVVS